MIKKDIFNGDVKEQFKAAAKDKAYRFLMADKKIKGVIVRSLRMINEMRANHELGPLETLVLGHGYIAAALMTSGLKSRNDRIVMRVQCSGPVRGMDVETNVYGEVRGYLKTGRIAVDNPETVKSLSTLYGAGFLSVTKYLDNGSIPYTGQVALEYGSIAEDLANYFLVSEQVPTGFKLSVFFDEKEEVKGAGGIFLQAMPGAEPDKIIRAEQIIQQIDSLGEMFASGLTPEKIITKEFAELGPQFLKSSRVEFFCRCSKDKMKRYLVSLPKKDRDDIIKNGPFPLELRCHHCNSAYLFQKKDLETVFKK